MDLTAGPLPRGERGDEATHLDLSIVVVSYNVRDLLRSCLTSVRTSLALSPGLAAEVWVVDNASTDGSAATVAREFPEVHLIAQAGNLGFAAANNVALRRATGRYVLLLNPDTVVLEDALGQMVRFLDERPDVGGLGVRLLNPDGSPQHGCFRFPTLWQIYFDFFPPNHRLLDSRLNGRYPLRDGGRPYPVDHPLGACFAVRREVIERVGLLDEGFFMYCEEIDWALRMRRAGWSIYCLPTAEVVHHGGQSTRQFRSRMFVELHRSRFRLFQKHYPSPFVWAARRLVHLGLTAEVRRAREAAARGEIDERELVGRLEAYREVWTL